MKGRCVLEIHWPSKKKKTTAKRSVCINSSVVQRRIPPAEKKNANEEPTHRRDAKPFRIFVHIFFSTCRSFSYPRFPHLQSHTIS